MDIKDNLSAFQAELRQMEEKLAVAAEAGALAYAKTVQAEIVSRAPVKSGRLKAGEAEPITVTRNGSSATASLPAGVAYAGIVEEKRHFRAEGIAAAQTKAARAAEEAISKTLGL